MRSLQSYADSRHLLSCAFCAGSTGTRDHCPSRVFLDQPYPENLPVVPACLECNAKFSTDEEYLACLISCVIAGSTDPAVVARDKVRRILEEKPSLRARLEQARQLTSRGLEWAAETSRAETVIRKLAQGHALHELGEPRHNVPTELVIRPMPTLSHGEREWFETPAPASIWPEVGSRAMQRMVLGNDTTFGWIEVQEGRYRYSARIGAGVEIRIVIHEYLAGYCRWED